MRTALARREDDKAIRESRRPQYSTKKLHEAMLKQSQERIIKEHRVDPLKLMREMDDNPNLTWNRIRENCHKKMREAVAETAFAALLRYGVQTQLLNIYELTDVSYRQWALVVPSKGFESYYAPTFRAGLPQRVERGEKYPEVQLTGITQTIRNFKFGSILAIEEELFEDDQTGQIPQRCAEVGENMAYVEERFFYNQSFQANYASVGMQSAGGASITEDSLAIAHNAATKVVDGLGNLIVVRPTDIVCDTLDELDARRVMETIEGLSNPGTAPSNGALRYFGTINPLKGMYGILPTPFLTICAQDLQSAGVSGFTSAGWGLNGTSAPWLLVMKRRGTIFQDRTPLSTMQEAPNSGGNFDADVIRYKCKRRFGAGTVDPRFTYRGN